MSWSRPGAPRTRPGGYDPGMTTSHTTAAATRRPAFTGYRPAIPGALRDAMDAGGWTIRQLAAASGIRRGVITHLRTGTRHSATARTTRALSRALGVPADDLFVLSPGDDAWRHLPAGTPAVMTRQPRYGATPGGAA